MYTQFVVFNFFFFVPLLLEFTAFAEIHSVALYNQKMHHNVCISGSKTCKNILHSKIFVFLICIREAVV